MKKIVLIFTVFFTTIICFIRCEKKSKCCDCPNSCGIIEVNEKECLMMCGEPEICPINSTITFTIYNYTNRKVEWNNAYLCEYFNGTDWVLASLGIEEMVYIKYSLKSDGIGELRFFLSDEYIHAMGKYRLIKSVTHPKIGISNLCAEFEIK